MNTAHSSPAPSGDIALAPETVVESGAPGDDVAAYRRCLGQFATGVTVITARAGGALVGVTVNSFSSVSLDPPLILWSAKRSNSSFGAFTAATHFAVNVLSLDQIELSKHFARPSGDKFGGIAWSPGIGGAPLLGGALASFECRRAAEYPGGDHLVILGEVERYARSSREALLFVQGRYSCAAEYPDLHGVRPPTPGPERPRGPMDEFMTALLYRAHGALSGALETGRRAEGLTLLQSRVMAAVQTLPGRTIDELLPDLFLGANAAEETVAELVAAAIVRADPQGRLSLTEAGRERNRRLLERARVIEADYLYRLPAADIAACRRVLDVLVEHDSAIALAHSAKS